MTLLRTLARPMLASMFVYGGVLALRDPKARALKAQPLADRLHRMAPKAPISAANLVRVNGAVHVVAGTALATGHMPRLASLALAATMPPTTAVGHQFWNETDPASRTNQTIHFLKNVSMAGGLLMATLDPEPHKKFIGRRAKDKVVEAADKVTDQIGQIRH